MLETIAVIVLTILSLTIFSAFIILTMIDRKLRRLHHAEFIQSLEELIKWIKTHRKD